MTSEDDIERRLIHHMAEQAGGLSFPGADPTDIINRPPSNRGRIVASAMALLVVVAAGAGFWSLTQGDEASEIAAGQSDNADDEPADEGAADGDEPSSGEATAVASIGLTITDFDGPNTPAGGRVLIDDGIYYVLSTAPGRVRLDTLETEEEWSQAMRPRTFYTRTEGEDDWLLGDVGDRFVSSFSIDDGVLYVLSTGAVGGDQGAAYGTSSDRGQSWDWAPLDLPEAVSQIALLPGDESSVVVAARWGWVDWQQAVELLRGVGLGISEYGLNSADSIGFSYYPTGDDPCMGLYLQFGLPQQAEWMRQASDDERAAMEEEFHYWEQEMGPELADAGCSIEITDIASLDLPDQEYRTWEEVGIEIPESWIPWTGVYRWRDGELTELDQPFPAGEQVSYLVVQGDQIQVTTWREPMSADAEGGETRWTTSDGIEWTSEFVSYEFEGDEGEFRYQEPGYYPPVAGDTRFRMGWDEPTAEELEAFEETINDPSVSDEEKEALEMATWGENRGYLERSVAGGPWERVEAADLAPDVDLGDRQLQDIRGTSLGVFLIFGPSQAGPWPPEAGLVILHSSSGVDWNSFETTGHWVDLHNADDAILAFDQRWPDPESTELPTTRAILITPAG